jgi:hypothetical protein
MTDDRQPTTDNEASSHLLVIPAKAGIQRLQSHAWMKPWIPAFAGMTSKNRLGKPTPDSRLPTPDSRLPTPDSRFPNPSPQAR